MTPKIIAKLRKQFPEASDIKDAGAVWVDGRLFVTNEFAQQFFGVVRRTITGWVGRGMPGKVQLDSMVVVWDFAQMLSWHSQNIDSGKGMGAKHNALVAEVRSAANPRVADLSDVDPRTADVETLERLKKYEDLKKIRLQNAELEGSLIPAEDQDRAMAEQAVIHLVQYQDDFEALPPALAMKSEAFIRQFLDQHYERRIDAVHSFITKEFDVPDKLHVKILEFIESCLVEHG